MTNPTPVPAHAVSWAFPEAGRAPRESVVAAVVPFPRVPPAEAADAALVTAA